MVRASGCAAGGLMLRPHPARWFEILCARDDATLALEALARTGAVELETRPGAVTPTELADVMPLLARFQDLRELNLYRSRLTNAEQVYAQLAQIVDEVVDLRHATSPARSAYFEGSDRIPAPQPPR